MTDRAYTVEELDDLRRLMENKFLYGFYTCNPRGMTTFSRCYHENEKVHAVEEMVRTAMVAGHTADDYRKSESGAVHF